MQGRNKIQNAHAKTMCANDAMKQSEAEHSITEESVLHRSAMKQSEAEHSITEESVLHRST